MILYCMYIMILMQEDVENEYLRFGKNVGDFL